MWLALPSSPVGAECAVLRASRRSGYGENISASNKVVLTSFRAEDNFTRPKASSAQAGIGSQSFVSSAGAVIANVSVVAGKISVAVFVSDRKRMNTKGSRTEHAGFIV